MARRQFHMGGGRGSVSPISSKKSPFKSSPLKLTQIRYIPMTSRTRKELEIKGVFFWLECNGVLGRTQHLSYKQRIARSFFKGTRIWENISTPMSKHLRAKFVDPLFLWKKLVHRCFFVFCSFLCFPALALPPYLTTPFQLFQKTLFLFSPQKECHQGLFFGCCQCCWFKHQPK